MVRKVRVVNRKNVIGQRTTTYVVAAADEQGITLRPMGVSGRYATVAIPHAQVASARRIPGAWHVETTGGHTYRVLPGFRKAQRELTDAAFGIEHAPQPQHEQSAGWARRNLDPTYAPQGGHMQPWGQ